VLGYGGNNGIAFGFLAAQLPHDFDGVFRQVVRMRLLHALNEGHTLFPETVQLWNQIR